MAKRIQDIRKELGFTQAEMATALGITRNYLALIETGRRPTPNALLTAAAKMLEGSGEHTDWKSRALLAEAKLAALKEAMSGILSRV